MGGSCLWAVFLGPDLLSSFVVAVVTVQRSSVPSLVSPCACPQSFATEGLPSHLATVFLGPDLLSSFVVAVVTVQRSSVPSLVSPCACPQSFATEGLPSHLASLCGLWHGKQAVAPFLLVLLQKIWRRRTVSGTVPWQASLPPICRFICHGVVLVVRRACRSVWKC